MRSWSYSTICILFSVIQTSLAALYDHYEDLPTIDFDFIVIGGGTAGNVIANRLTEDSTVNVLVLESGPSNLHVLNSIVPFFAFSLEHTIYDWNFTTTPQSSLDGRIVPFPKGHILGGCSSINGMIYTRGSSSDFNRFAKVTGDEGWSWNNIQKYIRKNERWTAPADNHNTAGQFDPAVHGFNGINAVSLSGFSHSTDSRIIQTTSELPEEFPFNLDMNSGNPLGLGWIQLTIDDGKRSSSATSYLASKFIKRPNLHVLLHTRVTRLLETSNSTDIEKPLINTVEFADESKREPRITLAASKEVILSAGVVGTPRILLNSGIGDPQDLRELGINPIVSLPDVGKNLSDQVALSNNWFVNSNNTLDKSIDSISTNATLRSELLEDWEKHKSGPLVSIASTHIAWSRLPSNSSIFDVIDDPASGENSPHYELGFEVALGGPSGTGNFINIATIVVSPASRGTIKLHSSDPFDPPLIDPGYLTSEFDIFAMREAVQSARRFLAAPVWKDYVIGPAGGLANATTDDLLDKYIRQNAGSPAHPVGTAAMSAQNASFGVVDPDLQLKAVSGLRVVDASVMPFITAGHTQAPVYIIAERAADLIKEKWKIQ
ncbi:Choline dehydrogenase, mitochondrial [Termitomyces sp. J132]|nr:Choline dehydrogenase, mitochondrial [Termitomyces sp. J132]